MRLVLCDDLAATATATNVVNPALCFGTFQQQQQTNVNNFVDSNPAQNSQVLNNLSSLQQPTPTGTLHLNETRLQQQQPSTTTTTDFLALHRSLFSKRPPGSVDFNSQHSNFGPPAPNFNNRSVATGANMAGMAASSLLNSFLMLNPLNPDFKRIYFSMLPKVVAEALDSGSTTVDDCKQILLFFASNPQLSWDERQIVESLAMQVEEIRKIKNFVKPRSNPTQWGVAGSASMSPNLYHKNRRMTYQMNCEDVFSRMKLFRCDSMNDETWASTGLKSSFSEPNSGMKDVPLWLKSLRLHKYSPLFARMNYDEMLELTEEKLEQKGVTVGARRKIILSVQKLKERVSLLQQLEKDLIDVSRVPTTLNELRMIIATPIRPNKVDQPESEDIPVFFSRALVRACSYLLSSPFAPNGSIDDESFSSAVHVIDRCLSHEAFMPQQKKRLVSLKQEMKRVWTPHHHHNHHFNPFHHHLGLQPPPPGHYANQRRFSLPPQPFPFAPPNMPIIPPPSLSCNLQNGGLVPPPMGVPGTLNPKCFAPATNPLFTMPPSLAPPKPKMGTVMQPNSLDIMPPLINLFNQHCSVQNHSSLQRTASAPVWNLPLANLATSATTSGSSCASSTTGSSGSSSSGQLTPPGPSVNSTVIVTSSPSLAADLQQGQRSTNVAVVATTDLDRKTIGTVENTQTKIVKAMTSSSLATSTSFSATSTAAYSPWSSFYSGAPHRSAWGCGLEEGAGSHSSLTTDLLPSLVAKGNGSSPLSVKNFASAPRASSSFTEYSIDQLCRSMMEAIDCCKQ